MADEAKGFQKERIELTEPFNASEGCSNENEKTQKTTKVGIYRQVLLTAFVTPLTISLANSLAFPALCTSQLRNKNETLYMDSEAVSWFTSVSSLTAPFGSMIAGFMMDHFGRKITLATPLIPLIITWIILANSNSLFVLFSSRIFLGILGGFAPPICQVYLGECTDPEFRGVTINAGYVSLSIGFLLTFALGAVMDWRYLAWCGIVFPVISLIGLFILPETPHWLIQKDRIEHAYSSLLWLRGDSNIAQNELNAHLFRINDEKKSAQISQATASWRDFFKPSALKPIVIIFSFILFFNLSGTYLIIYYAIDILSQVHLAIDPKNTSVVLSVVRLIVTVGFCWLFMKVKRRNIYLIAGIGSAFGSLALAACIYNPSIFPNETIKSWATGSLLLIYVATNTGFMIAPGFLTAELLPTKTRGRLAGCIYTYFSVVTFILNKFFPLLSEHIGIAGVLFVFGIASLATVSVIFFMVPETKGRSLLEIERYFQNHGWIYKKNSF